MMVELTDDLLGLWEFYMGLMREVSSWMENYWDTTWMSKDFGVDEWEDAIWNTQVEINKSLQRDLDLNPGVDDIITDLCLGDVMAKIAESMSVQDVILAEVGNLQGVLEQVLARLDDVVDAVGVKGLAPPAGAVPLKGEVVRSVQCPVCLSEQEATVRDGVWTCRVCGAVNVLR